MKTLVPAAILIVLLVMPVQAATLSKTYSYFTIGGTTLDEIEQELQKRGPKVRSTGSRHPGATRMEFKTRIGYGEKNGRCSVVEARVTVKADMILPRWNRRGRADGDTRLIWDTLAADIKRHEESHVVIARNHAREMEEALKRIRRERNCDRAQQKAKQTTAAILEKHDREQARFDKIEGINFESRMLRLIRYRMERIEAGTLR